jgi:2',3'-cyclic-nucleotide 2'-phosphodiesterase
MTLRKKIPEGAASRPPAQRFHHSL